MGVCSLALSVLLHLLHSLHLLLGCGCLQLGFICPVTSVTLVTLVTLFSGVWVHVAWLYLSHYFCYICYAVTGDVGVCRLAISILLPLLHLLRSLHFFRGVGLLFNMVFLQICLNNQMEMESSH